MKTRSANRTWPAHAAGVARLRRLSLLCASLGGVMTLGVAQAQVKPTAAAEIAPGSLKAADLDTNGPSYFAAHYRHMMKMPLQPEVYDQSGMAPVIPQFEADTDPEGRIGSYLPAGPVQTANNAFFQSLGTNGRSCFTCHQPANGMSISLHNINERFNRYGLRDPLFAPVDGATCPKNLPPSATKAAPIGTRRGTGTGDLKRAYQTLLERGLIRVAIPVNAPPRLATSAPVTEFTIEVVSDPYGCNTDPEYSEDKVDGVAVIDPDTGKPVQIISVYRRPRISANMAFATTAFSFPGPPTVTTPLIPPGNIMWDGREKSLESQAIDATKGHAQATHAPSDAQVQQIVAFETGFYSAQVTGPKQLDLTEVALGGPLVLSAEPPGQHTPITIAPTTTFALYEAWQTPPDRLGQKQEREAIAHGERLFNSKGFTINGDAGIDPIPAAGAAPVTIPGTCSTCHSQKFSGNDTFNDAQQDQGVGGTSSDLGGPAPSKFLPIFKITCKPGVPLGFHGSVITTNDPGLALITGKCADVGRLTVPQLRGLASRPPFFSDGSAPDLRRVVDFYNDRFAIKFTDQEKEDLVKFLNSL